MTTFDLMTLILQLSQPVSIDANWFVAGITSIASFLFWSQLSDIKKDLKQVVALAILHDKQIAVINTKLKIEKDES